MAPVSRCKTATTEYPAPVYEFPGGCCIEDSSEERSPFGTIQCQGLTVTAPVADWVGLVGCKLHAWLDRHSSQDTKRGSDGVDLIQLLRQQTEPPSATPPIEGLVEAMRWAAERVLIDQATLVRRLMLVHADIDIDIDEISLLGEEIIEKLA